LRAADLGGEPLGPPARLPRRLVADTTMFTDVRLREILGAPDLDKAVEIMARMLSRAVNVLGVEVYVAPSVEEEMERFMLANGVRRETLENLKAWLIVKPPSLHELRIPASVFRRYVEYVRQRLDRGLRIAEEHVRKAYHQEEARVIRGLRERFREGTRKGVVDSIQDVDTVFLAMELRAAIVSSDEGVRWLAQELGIPVLNPVEMLNLLLKAEQSLRHTETPPPTTGAAGEAAEEEPSHRGPHQGRSPPGGGQ